MKFPRKLPRHPRRQSRFVLSLSQSATISSTPHTFRTKARPGSAPDLCNPLNEKHIEDPHVAGLEPSVHLQVPWGFQSLRPSRRGEFRPARHAPVHSPFAGPSGCGISSRLRPGDGWGRETEAPDVRVGQEVEVLG